MKLGDWAVFLIHHPLNVNINDLSKIYFQWIIGRNLKHSLNTVNCPYFPNRSLKHL